MNSIVRDIFKAVHNGKWLSIEYRNKDGKTTKYWIGINDIDINRRSLHVMGLHIGMYFTANLAIYIDNIISSELIEGTYQPVNKRLVDDIRINPQKYKSIFKCTANLKILDYLSDCNKLDATPYKSNYCLIDHIDNDKLTSEGYSLSDEQFRQIVTHFQRKSKKLSKGQNIQQLALNLLSINTKRGIYVLAYRQLELDVVHKNLRPCDDVTICKEFTIDGNKQSIRKFLDADDYYLLDDYIANQEEIKDRITHSNSDICGVDDMPYVVCIEKNSVIDLSDEYDSIINAYSENTVTTPLKAFFGELTMPSRRRKDYPITLLNNNMNLDQLLSIHNAIKYPLTYVQGPPGTGKTSTIINTIVTAFFNEKTVLFTSYNNHPIDSVFNVLNSIKYHNKTIPFPILRLGNNERIPNAIKYIKNLYSATKELSIYEKTLTRNKTDKTEQTKQLTELLKKHEEIIDLNERLDAIDNLIKTNNNMTFQVDLQNRQKHIIKKRLSEIGEVSDEDAIALLKDDSESFGKYLYYTSAMYIKRLDEPKYSDFLEILNMSDVNEQTIEFNRYLSDSENLKKLLRVFPIIATTCISAHKLGEPKPHFDITIIDEASQCSTAVSLVPIIRGENLMLVGDPQQLNPVVLLDAHTNQMLREKYGISDEYDYISSSIYKTYLACDAVSDEILLSHHYRCAKPIIEFSNKKYYNGRLKINSTSDSTESLIFVDIPNNTTTSKNTAPLEAEEIVRYASLNKDKSIGVITPFTNQRDCINNALKEAGIENAACGTVHSFQGDEKDVILFSLALTDKTHPQTYNWLKNNKELVNVAVSRAKKQLIILSDTKELERLHTEENESDDIYELVQYVKSNGVSKVTPKNTVSRALGIKPYSTETEEAFLQNLNHAIGNILYTDKKCSVEKEVAISQVFENNTPYVDLFYTGRFDFVIYQRDYNNLKMPVLAIELDGKEHMENIEVMKRDAKKNEICRSHGFELIRVENSYARRYNFIKDILLNFFEKGTR